jgi:hypothetical protein
VSYRAGPDSSPFLYIRNSLHPKAHQLETS